jgi:hypothetical protein
LKEAEARLPAALTTAYRHILVPDKNKTIRCIDMGISVGKATLSQKVLDKLKDEQQILDKLDPAILIGERFGLWPHDQEMVNVNTLANYFTQLTHLPMLLGTGVLPECFAKGVQRGLFGYALGDGDNEQFDTIYLGDKTTTADRCEITESAWLLRPVLAKSLMPEPEEKDEGRRMRDETEPESSVDAGRSDSSFIRHPSSFVGGGLKIVKGERRIDKVRIDMKSVPWEHWNDVYNEVIDPLAKEGADIHCQVIIIAQGDGAIRENTVELGIKESLSQRGIKADIQTG